MEGILLPAVALLALSGCRTARIRKVNEALYAHRPSQTDDASRLLAFHSRSLLADRRTDYRVGPGDVLEVSIFEWELRDETKAAFFRVSETGRVSLPVIGPLDIGGKNVDEIKALIERRLREGGFIREPQVSVHIREFRSRRVAVVGAVTDPGVYTLRQNVTTLLDVLSLAGGVSARSGTVLHVVRSAAKGRATPGAAGSGQDQITVGDGGEEVTVMVGPRGGTVVTEGEGTAAREPGVGKPADQGAGALVEEDTVEDESPSVAAEGEAGGSKSQIITIDLYELMEEGNLALNMVLQHGDVINVPTAKTFSVIGFVGEPGSFALREPTTVLQGLAMARGLREGQASPKYCYLKRREGKRETVSPLNLVAISEGKAPNFYLQANDVILVRQTKLKKVVTKTVETTTGLISIGIRGPKVF